MPARREPSSRSPMSYKEALGWLFGTQLFGIKLGLENIERLLRALGVPAPQQRVIHVAGTNGKGSVCAMIDSILRRHGYRSGLFTSPHLVTFRERIQVDGEMIGEAEVANGLTILREMVGDWDPHPTFFELATALALRHFRERDCEYAVLETGMGGRLDATNAVTPIVSVITPIGYDHQKWLGDTLAEIAGEKAGIIKAKTAVVSAPQEPEAAAVILARATECEAPLTVVSENYAASPIALHGPHQKQNAAVAIAALRAAAVPVDEPAIVEGLASVNWPARFQAWSDRIIIDGAHNVSGARVLAQTWREVFGQEKAALILGVMRDKDATAIYRELMDISDTLFLPGFRGERALPPDELARFVRSARPEASITIAATHADALRLAEGTGRRILIAGSLHFAGEMLALLQGVPGEFEECSQ